MAGAKRSAISASALAPATEPSNFWTPSKKTKIAAAAKLDSDDALSDSEAVSTQPKRGETKRNLKLREAQATWEQAVSSSPYKDHEWNFECQDSGLHIETAEEVVLHLKTVIESCLPGLGRDGPQTRRTEMFQPFRTVPYNDPTKVTRPKGQYAPKGKRLHVAAQLFFWRVVHGHLTEHVVRSSPQIKKAVPVYLSGITEERTRPKNYPKASDAEFEQKFGILVQDVEDNYYLWPIAMITSNIVTTRSNHTLKRDLERSTGWFEDVHDLKGKDILSKLSCIVWYDGYDIPDGGSRIFRGHEGREQSWRPADVVLTGFNILDQSRWDSITPRWLPGLLGWSTINGATDWLLRKSPKVRLPRGQLLEEWMDIDVCQLKLIPQARQQKLLVAAPRIMLQSAVEVNLFDSEDDMEVSSSEDDDDNSAMRKPKHLYRDPANIMSVSDLAGDSFTQKEREAVLASNLQLLKTHGLSKKDFDAVQEMTPRNARFASKQYDGTCLGYRNVFGYWCDCPAQAVLGIDSVRAVFEQGKLRVGKYCYTCEKKQNKTLRDNYRTLRIDGKRVCKICRKATVEGCPKFCEDHEPAVSRAWSPEIVELLKELFENGIEDRSPELQRFRAQLKRDPSKVVILDTE